MPLARAVSLEAGAFVPFVQVTGMMVSVYAFGYHLLARDPDRDRGLLWIALAGRSLARLRLRPARM